MAFPLPPPPTGSLLSYAPREADDYYASPDTQRREHPIGTETPTANYAAAHQQHNTETAEAAINLAFQRVRLAQDALSSQDESQLGDVEFVTTPRLTNDRAFFALLGLTLLAVSPIMTHSVLMALGTGTVATYIFDLLGHRKATFASMIATLVVGWLAFYLANFADAWARPTAMLIVLSVGAIFGLAGMRGALQFQWFQAQAPGFALIADSITNAALPIATAPPLMAAYVGLVGPRWAPFVMCLHLCVVHYFFYRPMQSSFLEIATDVRQRAAEELVLLVGPVECAIATAFVVIFAPTVYLFIGVQRLAPNEVLNAVNVLALFAIPMMYLFTVGPSTTLWFLRYVPAPRMLRTTDELEAVEPTRNVLQVVERYRVLLLCAFYFAIVHFAVERIVNSRFAYLFVGVTPPYNYILLVAIGYGISALVACAYVLIRDDYNQADAEGELLSPTTQRNARDRTTADPRVRRRASVLLWLIVLVTAIGLAILVGVVTGMPGFFIPMSALSAACFVAYLVDRRAANNFVTFVCASTINLTWWMFRTFSFVRQDLKVIGDKWTMTTTELAGAVLLCYLFGCCCVGLSFSTNPGPLIVMLVLHGLKLTLIEHVLYSQHEAGVYPPLLVFATSAAGIAVAYRLFKNKVIPELAAAYVIGLYGSKMAVYLVHINTAENEEHTFALETTVTELFSMAAFAVLAMSELRFQRNEGLTRSQFASVLVTTFVVLAVGMRDTVLRIGVEWLGFNQPSFIQLTAASGVAAGLLGLGLTKRYAVLKVPAAAATASTAAVPERRQATDLYPSLMKWSLHTTVGSALLLICDPSLEALVTGKDLEELSDNPYYPPWWSRWSVFAVLGLFYAASRLPLPSVHVAVRGFVYVIAGVLLGAASSPLVIPVSDLRSTLALVVFLTMAAVTVLACHHGHFESDVCLILYLVSLVSLAISFISLNYTSLDVSEPHHAGYAIQAHAASRTGLLAVGCATNIVMSFALKCYLNGRPILSGARKLTPNMGTQCALVLNYATLIAYTTMVMLAYYVESDPCAVLVAASPLLLLLHNDGVLMTRLNKGPFRYFPPFVGVCITLVWHVLMESRDLYDVGRRRRMMAVLLGLVALVPSHFSLGRFLYLQKRRKTTVARVSFFVVLDFLVLLSTASVGVRWLAAVGIIVNFARLVISGTLTGLSETLASM